MNLKKHIIASILVGIIATIVFESPIYFLIAILTGVGIDIDHFVLSCYRHKSVQPIKQLFSNILTEPPSAVFNEWPIYSVHYLIVIHAIEGIVVGVVSITFLSPPIHITTIASIWLHISMDVYDEREHFQNIIHSKLSYGDV